MNRHEQKQQRNKKIMGWFVILVMIFSIAGFLFGSFGSGGTSTVLRYGDFKFEQTQQGYAVEISDEEHIFSYLPDEVTDISISPTLHEALQSPVLQFSYNEASERKEEFATLQFYLERDLHNNNVLVQRGTTTGEGLQEITCAQATPAKPVIILDEGDKTTFIEDNNCITITTGSTFELIRLYDRLRYAIYGVPEA
jgi:hypothetical protein